MSLTYGSVCSGIEAASVAWEPIGMKSLWFAEIETFPSEVLNHHWPEITNHGDMTKLSGMVKSKMIEAPDVLVGGTPCQAFSIAGLRESLDDDRGQLTLEFVRLANAIDTRRILDGRNESIIVWENVPGVLNTKDNAFGNFLAALCGEDEELQPPGKRWANAGLVSGPQRKVAWRVLDAQYFGVAQRRRRVFVVSSARADIDPAKILFEFDGLRRDSAPSREAGEEITSNVGTGFTTSSFANYQEGCGTLRAQGGDLGGGSETLITVKGHRLQAFGQYIDDETSGTCKARDYKDAIDLIVPCSDISPSITTGAPFSKTGKSRIEAEAMVTYGMPGNWIGRKHENGGNAVEPMENIAPCQTRTDRHAVAVTDVTPTLTSSGDGHTGFRDEHGLILNEMKVRRLTPTECERLQGFPDGYTQIPWKGKPKEECHDGLRYKALGNSMAVPVMRWIGERILNHVRDQTSLNNGQRRP